MREECIADYKPMERFTNPRKQASSMEDGDETTEAMGLPAEAGAVGRVVFSAGQVSSVRLHLCMCAACGFLKRVRGR